MTNPKPLSVLKPLLKKIRKKGLVARTILDTFGCAESESIPTLVAAWTSLADAAKIFETHLSDNNGTMKDPDREAFQKLSETIENRLGEVTQNETGETANNSTAMTRKAALRHTREIDSAERTLSRLYFRYTASKIDQRINLLRQVATGVFASLFVGIVITGLYYEFTYPALDEGLAASYYNNKELKGKKFDIVDHEINFVWNHNRPLKGINRDNFSVRWEGCIIVDKGKKAQLIAGADDGIRVFIDNKPIIDDWHANEFRHNKAKEILTGGIYPIKVEYFENRGLARVFLGWSLNGQKVVPVPFKNLVPKTVGPGFVSRNKRCPGGVRKLQ